jgi:hypothetical protein
MNGAPITVERVNATLGDLGTVKRFADMNKRGARMVVVKWRPCGHEVPVFAQNILRGITKSCSACSTVTLERVNAALGKLGVAKRFDGRKWRSPLVVVEWPCGHEVKVTADGLLSGHTKGCSTCTVVTLERVNAALGKLGTAKRFAGRNKSHHRIVVVEWPCGHKTLVDAQNIMNGTTKRCTKCRTVTLEKVKAKFAGTVIRFDGKNQWNGRRVLVRFLCGHTMTVGAAWILNSPKPDAKRCAKCRALTLDKLNAKLGSLGTVLRFAGKNKWNQRCVLVQWPCRHTLVVEAHSILLGLSKGCSTCKTMTLEKVNAALGSLGTALRFAGKKRHHVIVQWACGHTTTSVIASKVLSGTAMGCSTCKTMTLEKLNAALGTLGKAIRLACGKYGSRMYGVVQWPCGHSTKVFSTNVIRGVTKGCSRCYNGFGRPTAGSDGSLYRSREEAAVANVLREYGLSFESEKYYPGQRWRMDFYIAELNLIVEHAGMVTSSRRNTTVRYKARLAKKIKWAAAHPEHGTLVVTYPEDARDGFKRLIGILDRAVYESAA